MRHFTKMVLAVLLTFIILSAGQTVRAGGPEIAEWPLYVSGTVFQIDPENSTIVIYDGETYYTITGFPFGYLERELDSYFESESATEINKEDCVTVEYALVVCKTGTKYIAVALTGYCEACVEGEFCYEDDEGIVLRDEEFYPVDKSENSDDSDHYHNHKHP